MKNKNLLLLLGLISFTSNIIAQTGDYYTLGSTNNGCNDKVYCITGVFPASDVIYVGGAFGHAGGDTARYFAKWDEGSFTWSNMQPKGGHNGPVRAVTYVNNKLYAGGDFIISDSVDTWHVATWTGTQWSNLAGGIRGAGIWALCGYNNQLVAGGYIDTISGFNLGQGVERWDGTNWLTLGGTGYGVSGSNGFRVDALGVYNGNLYVGGIFQYCGHSTQISANNIAKWNGTSWSAVGTGANGEVRCITVLGNNLYIGGDFTSVNGVPANRIAKFDGTTWSAVGSGFDTTVYAVNIFNNQLYATGKFVTSGTDAVSHIARWDSTSGHWQKVWSGVGYPGINFEGYCLTPNNGSLYVGGSFTVAGTTNSIDITRFYFSPAAVNEISDNKIATVYPNPTTGSLTVVWKPKSARELSIDIYNLDGKLVAHYIAENTLTSTLLDLSSYARGFYFLKLTADNETTTEKLVLH